MRIAFGFDIFYPETNGVITTTINLARNLIELGHEVWFFVPYNKKFKDNVIENGIHIIHVRALPSYIYKGMRMIPTYGKFLAPILRKHKIDIVHNTTPWLMGMSLNHAARKLHIPTVGTHHTLIDDPIYIQYALKSMKLSKAATKAIWSVVFNPFYRLTWVATAPAKKTCRQIQTKYPSLDVRYISNGIDTSRFDKNIKELPLPHSIPKEWVGKRTLIYVGRLGYEKAIDVTFNAFSLCLEKNPDAKLICIGRGPAEERLQNMIQKLKMQDSILMTGLIPNNEIIGSKILSKCAAFVTASLSENQAITVIEALCSGAPVICADVPNMTAIVREDQGWFFKGGDEEDLARMMDRALNNTEEREKKSEAALTSIPLFDGRAVAKQFEELYYEMLRKRDSGFYVEKGEEKALAYAREIEREEALKNNSEISSK